MAVIVIMGLHTPVIPALTWFIAMARDIETGIIVVIVTIGLITHVMIGGMFARKIAT